MKSKNFYCNNIGVATALLTRLPIDFPEIQWTGRMCLFVFPVAEKEVRETVEAYYADRLTVSARAFENKRQELTMLMHQVRSGEGQ